MVIDMADGISTYLAAPPWEPLYAVGSHDGDRSNAQIAISVASASIVPDRPRVAAILWKSNLTHDFVHRSGTFALTLMTARQVSLIEPLGVRSGHDGPKLEALEFERTADGDPYFPGAVGYLACQVIDRLDLGDATLFVAGVAADVRLSGEEPITWAEAQKLLSDDVLRRYRAHFAADVDWARPRMR